MEAAVLGSRRQMDIKKWQWDSNTSSFKISVVVERAVQDVIAGQAIHKARTCICSHQEQFDAQKTECGKECFIYTVEVFL